MERLCGREALVGPDQVHEGSVCNRGAQGSDPRGCQPLQRHPAQVRLGTSTLSHQGKGCDVALQGG